jgi:serine/threonine protein phosphatase PrpC
MQENKLSAVCERVLDWCLAPSTAGGEGCDNMTMIVVQFKKPIGPLLPQMSNPHNLNLLMPILNQRKVN